MDRDALLDQLADAILAVRQPHPTRVGIDGVDGAGKTWLADELAPVLAAHGVPVIRASVDGFHHPRALRYRRGRRSPRGFYEDSYNHDVLHTALLEPLAPDGSRAYRTAVFDWRTDGVVVEPTLQAPEDAVLVFDGIFLHRPELRAAWDFSIFVDVTFETSLRRNLIRYEAEHGRVDAMVAEDFHTRYAPGQRLYLDACHPRSLASVVIDNNDLASPRFVGDQA